MLATALHWVNGPWQGKLALAARPRGGDWLADEIGAWQKDGIATIVSLLERQEELDLDLTAERDQVEKHGMKFLSFAIPDRDVPASQAGLGKTLDIMHRELIAGNSVVLHCRQGVGRTGLVAACLLISDGLGPQEAIERLTSARGVEVPETAKQRRWIIDFADALTTARRTTYLP
jgi:protein-tyrosine phosphatase